MVQKSGRTFKRTRGKKYIFTKDQTAAIKFLAKKSTMAIAETKYPTYVVGSSAANIDNVSLAYNLLYPISQGDGSGPGQAVLDGTSMFLKSIHLKGWLIGGTGTANDKFLRMTIIRTKKNLSNTYTSGTIFTASDVFVSNTTTYMPNAVVDTHKVDLLYDHIYKVPGQAFAAQLKQQSFDIKINPNRKEQWDTDNGVHLKYGDYYLVLWAYDVGGLTVPITFGYSMTAAIKDV